MTMLNAPPDATGSVAVGAADTENSRLAEQQGVLAQQAAMRSEAASATSYSSDTTEQPQPRFSLRQKLRSVFLVAMALWFVLNAALSFTSPIKWDPYDYTYRGWTWWVLNDLRHSSEESNVALLGSSLTVSAVAGCDSNYLNRSLDLTKYHEANYLNDKLQERFGGRFHTFNLAAPGQMPSDAYLTLKAMVATANRPDVVIYGVAPRDFIDSTLSGANDTEPFHYLTRLVNIDDVANAAFRSYWCKLDWFLQRTIYLYNYSLDFKLALAKNCELALDKLVPCPPSPHPFTWWDRVRMLPQYIPAEIHAEAMINGPITQKDISFKDNTKEYQARYRSPDPETYHTQMYFLRKLAEYCHRERIELIVVNMPIMYYNARMLPPGIYEKYVAALREFAWNYNIGFYDLCKFDQYGQADFHDTVHMNAFGAKKFFDSLVGELNKDPRAATALSMSGLQLEKHTALADWQRSWKRTY